jgi:hypothetical protein
MDPLHEIGQKIQLSLALLIATEVSIGVARVTVTVAVPHMVVKPVADEHAVIVAVPTAVGVNVTGLPVPLTVPLLVAVQVIAELNAPVP